MKSIHPFTQILRGAILALTLTVAGNAQEPPEQRSLAPANKAGLLIDYADFKSDSAGLIRLELYYQLFQSLLTFNLVNGVYEASSELTTVVRGSDDQVFGSKTIDRTVRVPTEQRTRSATDFRVSQVSFDLPPGKYEVDVTLRDKNSQQVITRELKVKLEKPTRDKPSLSGLELVQLTGAATEDTSNAFVKGAMTIIPSIAHTFSVDDSGRLSYYLEIYRGDENKDSTTIVESVIRNRSKMVYRDTLHLTFSDPTMKQFRQISLDGFTPGEYELTVTLRGKRYKAIDARIRTFYIQWTREALLKHDYETALQQLSYIAEDHVIKEMKKAETYEARKQAFERFWQERDPTPGTPDNEVRDEFYLRIEIANDRFPFLQQQGWRTDRGKVFIRFGEPDKVDDYPYSVNTYPYQVWHYYRNGHYRRFTFTDEIGDGDYRLAYPYDGLNERPDF